MRGPIDFSVINEDWKWRPDNDHDDDVVAAANCAPDKQDHQPLKGQS
jgi:hypothetical protein